RCIARLEHCFATLQPHFARLEPPLARLERHLARPKRCLALAQGDRGHVAFSTGRLVSTRGRAHLATSAPRSSVLGYAHRQKQAPTRFLDDGCFALDNNRSECACEATPWTAKPGSSPAAMTTPKASATSSRWSPRPG